MSRVSLRAALSAGCALLFAPAAAFADDFSGTALNIIPSGQYGGLPVPPGADVQAKMYDALTPLGSQVPTGDLLADFKSEKFGATDSCPCKTEAVPPPGVKITRDRFNVPHITG